jgi:hypothetical protein
VIVVVLSFISRPCPWGAYTAEFGPNGKNNADIGGFIWLWSDEEENAPTGWAVDTYFGSPIVGGSSDNEITWPTASISTGPGPAGGYTMVAEIFNGHRVDLFWPGTGPMTDTAERAALKDVMQSIRTAPGDGFDADRPNPHGSGHDSVYYIGWAGDSGTLIMPEDFVADDSIDPCTNNGQGKRVFGVTCIGGHVVSLYFTWTAMPAFPGFPASISGLTKLRHFYSGSTLAEDFVIPCEFGQLAELVAFIYRKPQHFCGRCGIVFPEEDSCMNGLLSLEEIMIGAHPMNRFPASLLTLPKMQKLSLNKAPIQELPATMPPDLRILVLSGVGASGPPLNHLVWVKKDTPARFARGWLYALINTS